MQAIESSRFYIEDFDASNLKHFIQKKTLRGRKAKNPLPDMPKCSICLEFEECTKESLISCSICKAKFHPSCYHENIPDDDFYNFTCQRCKEAIIHHKKIESIRCLICDGCDGILKRNISSGEYYHEICYKLLPELHLEEYDALDEEHINKLNIRKWRYKTSCKYCQDKLSQNKVVIKCGNPKCREFYHIPCAIEKGMIFSINYLMKFYSSIDENYEGTTIPFYCSCHNKKVACSYRNDVLYNNNEIKIEKIDSTNSEDNSSTTNENMNEFIKQETFIESKSKIEEDFFESCFEECFDEKNKIMNLDFDAIKLEGNKTKEYEEEYPNIENSFPQSKFPFNFHYDENFNFHCSSSNLFPFEEM